MDASDLNERIEIYRQVKTSTPSGASDIQYEFRCSTRARVNYASGNRTITNDTIFYDVDREFIVRHYIPVENTDEIRWNNQRWRILSIDKSREFHDIIIRTTLFIENE